MVAQVMHAGVIDCPPQATLREVAASMASRGVHCVVVDGLARAPGGTERLVWGIVSDVDLMRAAAAGRLDDQAGELAVSEVVTVEPHEPIDTAARLMAEHDSSHLVVVDPASGRPTGVVSSLDVARAIAGS
jgi:CBS domain-containing protein